MMKKNVTLTLAFAFAILTFTACKKEQTFAPIDAINTGAFRIIVDGKITTVQNLMADTIIGLNGMGMPYGSGKFSFFSLETGTLVDRADSATNKWDVAFRGTTILTNSGVSGPGLGGGFVQVGTFDGLTSISADSTFRTDSVPGRYAITTGSNKGWYTYDGANNLITPLPGRVLVIRTATGKYAKLEITSYYKTGVTPAATASDALKLSEQRYYNYRFTFQPNGTKNF